MNEHNTGLECPKCGCRDLRQYYTRKRQGFILRKRICRNCGQEMMTSEKIFSQSSGNGTILRKK